MVNLDKIDINKGGHFRSLYGEQLNGHRGNENDCSSCSNNHI
jgi:hypothetical protein